jgi:WD40 repeat protein/serine/threonine protein kinase
MSAPTPCPGEAELTAFNRGELAEEDLDAIAAHLETCAGCGAVLDNLDTAADPFVEPLRQLGASAVTVSDAAPRRVGEYDLLEPLGRGGMGAVYRARHRRLGKVVALKILSGGGRFDPALVGRFRREAWSAGHLDHPNIVQATDAGEADGVDFLAMEYVAGVNLSELIRRAGPLRPADACEIARQAALGLGHAHAQQLVHRDVKPSNLMLSQSGTVKLLDLGVARTCAPDVPGDASTVSGYVVGSLDFMAPEQAADPRAVDARADLYALGCTLYYLLAGEPPFAPSAYRTAQQKIRAHAEEPPLPLAESRNDLPPGLSELVDRLLAKGPADRPASAAEVAEALTPFAAGNDLVSLCRSAEGSSARVSSTSIVPPGSSGRGNSRLRKRRRRRVALAAAALLVAAGAAALILSLRSGGLEIEGDAPGVRIHVEAENGPELVHDLDAGRRVRLAPGRYRLSVEGRPELELAPDRIEVGSWRHEPVQLRLRPGLPAQLGLRLPLPDSAALARTPSPADALDRTTIPSALLPVGAPEQLIAVLGDSGPWHPGPVNEVSFSPDGARVAAGGPNWAALHLPTEARVWDAATGRLLHKLAGHTAAVRGVAFGKGDLVATAGADRAVRVWDGKTGRLRRDITGLSDTVVGVAFSADGSRLACSQVNGVVTVREVATGDLDLGIPRQGAEVTQTQFSPDGTRLAGACLDGSARVWDSTSGNEVACFQGHKGGVVRVAYDRDGTRLATASLGGDARVWDLRTRECLNTFDHPRAVACVAFRPDGAQVATACYDGKLRLWDARTGRLEREIAAHAAPARGVAYDPEGRRLVSGGDDGRVRFWDAATGRPLLRSEGHSGPVLNAAFSPDGRTIATAGTDGTVRLWDTATARQSRVLTGHMGPVPRVAFSPDGRLLASAGADGTARLWDAAQGTELRALPVFAGGRGWVRGLAFAPDGRALATAMDDGLVKIWDPVSGELLRTLHGHKTSACAAAFSPSGKVLATASDDLTIKLWDPDTATALLTLERHTDHVHAVAFLPDGYTLVSTSHDRTVRLWDLATCQPLVTLRGHTGTVTGLAVHPDGRSVASLSEADGTLRLWDLRTDPVEAAVVRLHAGSPQVLTQPGFSPEGRYLAVPMPNGTIYLLRIEALAPGA